jgi:hypothetical protein
MKVKYFIFTLLISATCFAQSQDKSGKDFYYYKGEKYYLDVDYSRISTGAQVQDIISSTAQKVRTDLYTYSTTSGYPYGTWNNQMGYGLIDAYAAVMAANPCVNSYTNQTVTSNTTVIGCNDLTVQNVTVSNNAKLTLEAPGSVTIYGTFEVQSGASLDVKQ